MTSRSNSSTPSPQSAAVPVVPLAAAWDSAADALEDDAMRATRYGKCFRYLAGLPRNSASVLEVGCGEGSGLLLLHQLGFERLFGIEVSAERARRAASKLPPGTSVQVNSPTDPLPFRDGTFDAVVSAAVIEHTVDPDAFVAEIGRVTKAGGMVIISSDCYSWRILQILGIYQTAQPIDRAQPAWRLRRQFERHGLAMIHSEGFPLPGHEYRFLKLLFAKPVAYLRRLGRVRKWFRLSKRVSVEKTPSSAAETGSSSALETWKPRPWLLSLPGLLLSDENVFLMRKGKRGACRPE